MSNGGGVVGCYWGGSWLRVPHFFECDTQWDGFFAAIEKQCDLCLGGRGHDMFDDGGENEHGAIVEVGLVSLG